MMRAIRATIRRNTSENGPSMVYPKTWNAQEVDRNGKVVSPGLGGYGGDLSRGADSEYVVAVVKEGLAEKYVADPDIKILSETEANALLSENRTKNNISEIAIKNPELVEIIKLKLQRGLSISTEEEKALDPNDSTPGINKIPLTIREMVSDEIG